MELVNELALFERAPEEVTVTLQEFEEPVLAKNRFGRHLWPKWMG